MTNPYKDAVKTLTPKKNDWLGVQNTGGSYTLTINGHLALRLDPAAYAAYFHNAKPLVFPILEDGQAIRNGEPMPPIQYDEIFREYDSGTLPEMIRTPWTMDRAGDSPLRAFLEPGGPAVYFDTKYSEPFKEARAWCGPGGHRPMFGDLDDGVICLLPVNACDRDRDQDGRSLAAIS